MHIKGKASHDILTQALHVLESLAHRGGIGAEPDTGDGAGILTQLPHAFFDKECKMNGIVLPRQGAYGVGMLFLSSDEKRREKIEHKFE